MRVLAELLHIVAGLAAALAVTWVSAWAYPLGAKTIWTIGGVAMVLTVLMGINPLRRAIRITRARRRAHG
ncbi:hypothetical protein ACFO8O_07685 [Hephaestia sp. GCM10023244]|uniref:hypothetical protein n=1 Tax=unclassified Hephaestia TaxID=2631281 RepID=UPI00207732D9|nr:hypothetical protein [Hephaestia sp. MAHUQ-44]MCM8730849.1 hypothetical protein [Hephaestia sp. MAHUQ-44]